MYTSPKGITAFDEQDIETVLADELADRTVRPLFYWQGSQAQGKRNWLQR